MRTHLKLLYRMAVIPVDAQKDYPLAFCPFLGVYLDFYYGLLVALYQNLPTPPHTSSIATCKSWYPSTPATSPASLERLAICAMKFLSQVLSTGHYKVDAISASTSRTITARGDMKVNPEVVAEANSTCARFFSDEMCTNFFCFVVEVLLPLRTCDLDEWASNPEAYMVELDSLTSDDRCPRCVAESLSLALMEAKKELLAPLMAQRISDVASQHAAAEAEAHPSNHTGKASSAAGGAAVSWV